MKLTVIFLFFTTTIIAQTNFAAQNGNLQYQQTFNDSVQLQQFKSYLLKNIPIDQQLTTTSNTIVGYTQYSDIIHDKSSLGVIFKRPVKYKFVIEFKENKYRVTITNINFRDVEVGVLGVTDSNPDAPAETYLLKNKDNTIRNNKMTTRVLTRLENAFNDLFTYKIDNW
ncbi:hypothetical protein I5168_12115 [Nonlabens sp. SCSIO 43208]|uniref:hypothetical protein n=1 Tax=Nonlabens sp. SCSIO 43208 TaxID=2793009 RepID=UPI003D6BA986